MRIVRYEDMRGNVRYGREDPPGVVEELEGDPFSGLSPTFRTADVLRFLAPVEPVNIFCVGLNYRAHAQETGLPIPEDPVLFMKPTTAVVGPDQPIRIPACCEHGPEVDYEGELAVVIGRKARDVPEERALDFVLGYTVANDVSARRWQKHNGGQWIRGKSFDTFCPLGPALVTRDDIPDPQALRIRTALNGELVQDGGTDDMIFPVARLVSFLSRDTTLLPGTVILTGTPPGVGFARNPPVFLRPGDLVSVEIEGIGRLTNRVTGPDGA
ncbi:MAG: fumarylacetoacetate hydrolase family protein [Deltaproteobacteria bacterium]|nr:fumarylacetoacetate hydrolase family protein [Deltaproteobacteria bacterium]